MGKKSKNAGKKEKKELPTQESLQHKVDLSPLESLPHAVSHVPEEDGTNRVSVD